MLPNINISTGEFDWFVAKPALPKAKWNNPFVFLSIRRLPHFSQFMNVLTSLMVHTPDDHRIPKKAHEPQDMHIFPHLAPCNIQ